MSDTLARPLDKAQLTAAVAALRDEAVTLLSDLVRHPSLLGDERSAQDHMRGVFEGMGLRVDEFAIDEAKIKGHPGYSPSIVSYDGRHNVVGVHEPKHGTHGKSLVCNGHIQVELGREACRERVCQEV